MKREKYEQRKQYVTNYMANYRKKKAAESNRSIDSTEDDVYFTNRMQKSRLEIFTTVISVRSRAFHVLYVKNVIYIAILKA